MIDTLSKWILIHIFFHFLTFEQSTHGFDSINKHFQSTTRKHKPFNTNIPPTTSSYDLQSALSHIKSFYKDKLNQHNITNITFQLRQSNHKHSKSEMHEFSDSNMKYILSRFAAIRQISTFYNGRFYYRFSDDCH